MLPYAVARMKITLPVPSERAVMDWIRIVTMSLTNATRILYFPRYTLLMHLLLVVILGFSLPKRLKTVSKKPSSLLMTAR
jgi:hypothetical protein